jgi:hypothetical protein
MPDDAIENKYIIARDPVEAEIEIHPVLTTFSKHGPHTLPSAKDLGAR